MTEPDIIIELSDELIFIEAKYRSKNERKNKIEENSSRFKKFSKYLDIDEFSTLFNTPSKNEIINEGFYELTRNWVAGNLLAKKTGKLKFTMINLVDSQNLDEEKKKLQSFISKLRNENKKFEFQTWQDIISKISPIKDNWFCEYLKNHKITANGI